MENTARYVLPPSTDSWRRSERPRCKQTQRQAPRGNEAKQPSHCTKMRRMNCDVRCTVGQKKKKRGNKKTSENNGRSKQITTSSARSGVTVRGGKTHKKGGERQGSCDRKHSVACRRRSQSKVNVDQQAIVQRSGRKRKRKNALFEPKASAFGQTRCTMTASTRSLARRNTVITTASRRIVDARRHR